ERCSCRSARSSSRSMRSSFGAPGYDATRWLEADPLELRNEGSRATSAVLGGNRRRCRSGGYQRLSESKKTRNHRQCQSARNDRSIERTSSASQKQRVAADERKQPRHGNGLLTFKY